MHRRHAMPFGAEPIADGVKFRLWAPDADDVALELEGGPVLPMRRGRGGWAEVMVPGAAPGAAYRFRAGGLSVPDPGSRFQPDDVHGPSRVVDPGTWEWRDGDWRGRPWHEAVIYELHVGTFTPEGTFRAAIDKLDYLVGLGVTAIELMPVAEFPGARGWGYDGVLPYAPEASYGSPDDFKALVEAAHRKGLMVFLDVVYNHFGPDVNYLHVYARRFFTRRHHTPWGQAINYDGRGAKAVREFVIHNALYWIEEFHLDGLRLDAVHAIVDDTKPHLLEELARRVRAAVTDRPVHLVLENDDNTASLLEPGLFDAQWNDDLHHVLHVLLTGEVGGYYRDYADDPAAHLARCLSEGFAYQGEPSSHRKGGARGQPSAHLRPTAFVGFLQNHDQIGNRALGERIDRLAPAPAVDAALALLLLLPQPPLLFMGEEWGASTPFLFFCDFRPDLARSVREGRKREFENFPQFKGPNAARIPDPNDPATFAASKLDWSEPDRDPHAGRLDRVRRLLAIRQRQLAPRLAGIAAGAVVEVVGSRAVTCRWRLGDGSLLTLRANLSDQAVEAAVSAPGRLLYSTGGEGGALPPWRVDWHLDEGRTA
ncbi:MAG: malto-oligosyltrehalose trehalohydrolase [Actinomycetota bacterium]